MSMTTDYKAASATLRSKMPLDIYAGSHALAHQLMMPIIHNNERWGERANNQFFRQLAMGAPTFYASVPLFHVRPTASISSESEERVKAACSLSEAERFGMLNRRGKYDAVSTDAEEK